jgi:hypothetical protein
MDEEIKRVYKDDTLTLYIPQEIDEEWEERVREFDKEFEEFLHEKGLEQLEEKDLDDFLEKFGFERMDENKL